MTLYKRGRNYSIQLWVDGIRYLKATGTTNRREAEGIERAFRDELNRKRHQIREASPDMTFAELSAKFLVDGSPKPHHLDRLKILLPYFGEWRIGTISKPAIREYRTARHKAKKLTETTINRDVEVIRHLLYWAVEEGYLPANPLFNIHLPKPRRKPRPVMTLEEEDKALAATSPHLHDIAIAALDAGLRRKEILTQLMEHIDFARNLLAVTCSKTAEGDAREIPLTARFRSVLLRIYREKKTGLVFTYKDRSIQRIKTAWKATIRRAGIRYIRFHYLRHTFNTRLMEAGVIEDVRKALMGHSAGGTNAIYTHVEMPVKRKAIYQLEAWIEAERKNHQRELGGEQHEETGTTEGKF